jgi:uncharacterized alkaline shock family protein YloU
MKFRILLVENLACNLNANVDVKTTLSYGNLKEEIFMEIAEGIDGAIKDCLSLNKTIYCLV